MLLRLVSWLLPASLLSLAACGDPLPPLHFRTCEAGRCPPRSDGGANEASLPDGFVPGNCEDGQQNAFETGIDCGGPDCTACASGQGCALRSDCISDFCFAAICRPGECRNTIRDGDESDVDCGGACAPCDGAKTCGADSDCASGSCTPAHRCDGPSCSDNARNGDESDLDCGGSRCESCALGQRCTAPSDCGSAQCVDAVCVDLSCSDGEQNNSETDLDCGGTCNPCAAGRTCAGDTDCATQHCIALTCVSGPTAGFTLSVSGGAAPLSVAATSSASAGDSAIVEVLYDWDDGSGFEPLTSYRYTNGGSFTVRQQVRDQNGISASASVDLPVGGFVPVRFDPQDHTDNVFLSPDRLAVEQRGVFNGGARSDGTVAPGSGVFYFEAHRLIDRTGNWGFGVATDAAALDGEPGSSAESVGLTTLGAFQGEGSTCTGESGFDAAVRDYGFVVDYRGVNPRIHMLLPGAGATPLVRRSCTMSVTTPLHVFYFGARYVVGFQGRINAGSDTTNFPFSFPLQSARNALIASGEVGAAGALVAGFGQTRARPVGTAPQLTAPSNQSVALGASLMLSATATDAQDGVLTDRIVWTDLASQHHAPLRGYGGTFAFTPGALGRHPVIVSVRDGEGLETRRTVVITVTGTLPQAAAVRLTPDALAGAGVTLSSDGLSARMDGEGKYGIRANQGIYGQFWYFEAHREGPPGNQAVGLVIGDGALNPYRFEEVPWSCSVNLSGSTWRNLISLVSWPEAQEDYGFAVDYRGEHPIVFIIIGNALHMTLTLDDVWVPLYPMVYGNPHEPLSTSMDVTVNFGTDPFKFDPRPLLGASAGGLEMRWGANTPPRL